MKKSKKNSVSNFFFEAKNTYSLNAPRICLRWQRKELHRSPPAKKLKVFVIQTRDVPEQCPTHRRPGRHCSVEISQNPRSAIGCSLDAAVARHVVDVHLPILHHRPPHSVLVFLIVTENTGKHEDRGRRTSAIPVAANVNFVATSEARQLLEAFNGCWCPGST